jgi:hypothetical protein
MPLLAPADCGANVILQVTPCPPLRVTGMFRPLRAKPVPDKVALVKVIFDPPEFARMTDCVWLPPTGTVPKLRFEGFTVSCPEAPNAGDVNTRIAEAKRNKRNPREISFHLEPKFSTA